MTNDVVVRWRGDWLRARREALGISEAGMADRVGVHQNTIARWESGDEPRGMQQLARIAAALACDVDELFEFES